jgi:hypothetical protein
MGSAACRVEWLRLFVNGKLERMWKGAAMSNLKIIEVVSWTEKARDNPPVNGSVVYLTALYQELGLYGIK